MSRYLWKQTEKKLARVFNNLISNAFKYGRDGKHVYLSVKQLSSKEVVVKIENDGEPIPEAAVPQLFDRFYRAESSRSRETGGSGLGLAIVQSIVERHNGYIYVESNAALTSFVMHFPTEHKNVVRKPAKAEKGRMNNEFVLFVGKTIESLVFLGILK